MRHEQCDIDSVKDAILEMSTRHPEIDAHIDDVLEHTKKRIDPATMRRLKEVVMLYCTREWKHVPKVAFVAYCMQEFYDTDDMFDDAMKEEIKKFIEENNSPDQLEFVFVPVEVSPQSAECEIHKIVMEEAGERKSLAARYTKEIRAGKKFYGKVALKSSGNNNKERK